MTPPPSLQGEREELMDILVNVDGGIYPYQALAYADAVLDAGYRRAPAPAQPSAVGVTGGMVKAAGDAYSVAVADGMRQRDAIRAAIAAALAVKGNG